jgi:hypothetical protein
MAKYVMGQDLPMALIEMLGLPKNTISFTLKAGVGRITTVECEYRPDDDKTAIITERFRLVKI